MAYANTSFDTHCCNQGDQEIGGKSPKFKKKEPKQLPNKKNVKISFWSFVRIPRKFVTVQSLLWKTKTSTPNHFLALKACVETAYKVENVIKFALKKPKMSTLFWLLFSAKNSSGLLKSSPIGKILLNLVTLVATKFNFIVQPKTVQYKTRFNLDSKYLSYSTYYCKNYNRSQKEEVTALI